MTKRMVSLALLAGVGLFGCQERVYEDEELTRAEEPVADPYLTGEFEDEIRAEDPIGVEPSVEPVGGLDDEEGLRQVGRERTRAREQVHTPPETAAPPATGTTTTTQGVAMLHSAEGEKAGVVRLSEQDGTVTVKAELKNVESLSGGATVRIAEHGDCDSLMAEATGDEPAASGEEPAASGEQPAASGEQPAASGEELAAGEAEPTTEAAKEPGAEEPAAAATADTTADPAAGKDLARTEITFESGQMTAEQKLTGVGFEGAQSVIGHAVVIETKGETAETYCGVVGIDQE